MDQFKRGYVEGMVGILAKGARFTKMEWLRILLLKDADIPQEERARRMAEIVAPKVDKIINDYVNPADDDPDITIDELTKQVF